MAPRNTTLENPGGIAYSYIRFSSPRQAMGRSLERQTELARSWCERNGFSLDTSLRLHDLGVSAFRGANADIGRLAVFLKACEEGRVPKASVLLVESLDRLSREHVYDAVRRLLEILDHGVDVVTLSPEQWIHSDRSTDASLALIVAVVVLSRANEESATKSKRLRDSWNARRTKIVGGERIFLGSHPAWLRWDARRRIYVPISERVTVVRDIFRWSVAGNGQQAIVTLLNKANVPTFSGRSVWTRKSIERLLGSRAVFGELQLHHLQDGKRVEIGPPIQNYYPEAVSKEVFYAAQGGTKNRTLRRGRPSVRVSNLFTGLIFDLRSGEPFHVLERGLAPWRIPYCVPATRQKTGHPPFRYDHLERAFLHYVRGLRMSELTGNSDGLALAQKIAATEARLTEIETKIAAIQEDSDSGQFRTILDILKRLETKQRETKATLEELQAEAAVDRCNPLPNAQITIGLLADENLSAASRANLRAKLKVAIRDLVRRVDVLAVPLSREARSVYVEVSFHAGGSAVIWFRYDGSQLIAADGWTSPIVPVTRALEGRARSHWIATAETVLSTDEPRRLKIVALQAEAGLEGVAAAGHGEIIFSKRLPAVARTPLAPPVSKKKRITARIEQ